MKFFFFTLFIGGAINVFSQDVVYAKEVIETLASPSYHGRGYVKKGHKIAANYIAKEFKSIGLKSWDGDYFQLYSIDVNTFPSKVELVVGDETLTTGEDYIIAPYSGSAKGKYEVLWIDTSNYKFGDELVKSINQILVFDRDEIQKKLEKKRFDRFYYETFKSKQPSIFLTDKKLTWSLANINFPFPIFEVKKSSFPKTAQSVQLDVKHRLLSNLETQNVIGWIEGKTNPDSFIVFSAHYDHLGRMGKDTYIPGANDNASGISMLLNLAKHFQENIPYCSMVFIAFGAEEVGLLGSKFFVKNPLFPLENIKFVFNMDIMGTGDEGITVVNATLHPKEFESIKKINEEQGLLANVKSRGEASNSDHYWFTEKGVPAFFVYAMGGIQAYHDVYDKSSTLPLTKYKELYRLIVSFISTIDE